MAKHCTLAFYDCKVQHFAMRNRRQTLGIATKLYLAFGGIFLLAIVAAMVGWQGFQRVTDSQNSVIDQAIPGLRQAHELSQLNASIGAAAQQLLRADNEDEREQSSEVLSGHVESLNQLLDNFQQSGFAEPSIDTMRRTFVALDGKLRQQDNLVRRRIHQQNHLLELSARLIDATGQLNDLADSLVANAAATTTAITSSLYDLVEDDASQSQLYTVFDRLIEVDIDAMERMYELRLRNANLRELFTRVTKESNTDVLSALRQQTSSTLSILKRRVHEINDPQRRKTAETLLVNMEVDNGPLYVYGIFETRLSLLDIQSELAVLTSDTAALSQTLNDIVNELNVAGGTLINQVSTDAKESLDVSRTLFNSISVFSLLIAAVILWGFVKRNVIRRLLSLQAATQAISHGNYDVNIIDEGTDELAEMGKALQGFRTNAIEKRKLDDELHEHKVHLEELVESRTEELKVANDKLALEAEKHAVAREKAEQANQAKTAFLATMSHELRTPLSGALGTVHLLSETELQPGQRDYVNTIDAANTTLLDIVNDILGYSQLEAGKLKVDNKPFELETLLKNVSDLMEVSIKENENSLHLNLRNTQHIELLGDSGKLHQILINLIGNANKFTHQGQITLHACCDTEEKHNSAALSFITEDTGIGIASEKHEEIFQAFTQVDTSSARQYGGVGLGLAICDRLVHALGGHMTLESEPGIGTQIGFEVSMQLADNHEEVVTDSAQTIDTACSVSVLMVEDDATNRMVTSSYLNELGHRVLTARTGEEAIDVLKNEVPDLGLLDISLPGIDGLDILKHIRAHHNVDIAELPVIAMSAHVFTEEVDRYIGAGMNGFLGKPFSIQDLGSAISQGLNKTDKKIEPLFFDEKNTIIDTDALLTDVNKLGVNQVEELLTVFSSTVDELMVTMSEAVEQKNITVIEKSAHQLRGAAGNFGLEILCDLLSAVEVKARNAEAISSDEVGGIFSACSDGIDEIQTFLSRYQTQPNAAGSR